jgi:hypothetical protein
MAAGGEDGGRGPRTVELVVRKRNTFNTAKFRSRKLACDDIIRRSLDRSRSTSPSGVIPRQQRTTLVKPRQLNGWLWVAAAVLRAGGASLSSRSSSPPPNSSPSAVHFAVPPSRLPLSPPRRALGAVSAVLREAPRAHEAVLALAGRRASERGQACDNPCGRRAVQAPPVAPAEPFGGGRLPLSRPPPRALPLRRRRSAVSAVAAARRPPLQPLLRFLGVRPAPTHPSWSRAVREPLECVRTHPHPPATAVRVWEWSRLSLIPHGSLTALSRLSPALLRQLRRLALHVAVLRLAAAAVGQRQIAAAAAMATAALRPLPPEGLLQKGKAGGAVVSEALLYNLLQRAGLMVCCGACQRAAAGRGSTAGEPAACSGNTNTNTSARGSGSVSVTGSAGAGALVCSEGAGLVFPPGSGRSGSGSSAGRPQYRGRHLLEREGVYLSLSGEGVYLVRHERQLGASPAAGHEARVPHVRAAHLPPRR